MPLEILSGYTSNVAAVNTRVTMFGEDSDVIRSGIVNGNIYLLAAWSEGENGRGVCQIRSPRLHDNVNGIQFPLSVNKDNFLPLFPNMQKLVTQDNLNIFMNTTVGESQYVYIHLLIYYEELPESQGKYITYENLLQNNGQIMTLKHDITPTSNIAYSGGEVITTNQDEFDALENYAFLGFKFVTSDHASAMCLRGHDTGNLRIGQPKDIFSLSTGIPFFKWLAKVSGLPCIPVINAANKDNTFIDMAGPDTLIEISFFSYWEQLK